MVNSTKIIPFRTDWREKSLFVLLGIDGTGKSTQASILYNYLKSNKVRAKIIYAGNTGIKLGKKHSFYFSLPVDIVVNRFFNGSEVSRQKFCVLYQFLLFFNYVMTIIPKIIFYNKLGYTIIADRYVYDYILSTIIAKTYSPLLSKLLIYLTPTPSLIMFLDMPSELTHKRKNEEKTLTEIDLSRLLYLDFQKLTKINRINSENSVNGVFLTILGLMKKSTRTHVTPQVMDYAFQRLNELFCEAVYNAYVPVHD